MEADRKIGWTFKSPYPASEPVLWRRLLGTSMDSSCCNKCVPGFIRVATLSPNRPRPISYFLVGLEPAQCRGYQHLGTRWTLPPIVATPLGIGNLIPIFVIYHFLIILTSLSALLHHNTFIHWSLYPDSRTIVSITFPTFDSNLGRGTWLLSLTTRTIRVAWPLSGKMYMDVYSCGSRSLIPDSSHIVT